MIIATIKKLDGTYLDHGNFESEAAALAWFQPFIDKGVYGQKHVPVQYRDVEVEIAPAVINEQGVEITPAVTETQQVLSQEEIPAAFSIEFVDSSSIPKSQDEINAEAQEFLDSSDFMVLRHLRQQALGITTSLTAQEYLELEQERQMASQAIIK